MKYVILFTFISVLALGVEKSNAQEKIPPNAPKPPNAGLSGEVVSQSGDNTKEPSRRDARSANERPQPSGQINIPKGSPLPGNSGLAGEVRSPSSDAKPDEREKEDAGERPQPSGQINIPDKHWVPDNSGLAGKVKSDNSNAKADPKKVTLRKSSPPKHPTQSGNPEPTKEPPVEYQGQNPDIKPPHLGSGK